MVDKALTTKNGALWVQPDGPNTALHYLGCHDLDDVTEPLGNSTLVQCFDPNGNWETKGEETAPPGAVTAKVNWLTFAARSWMEKIKCNFGLYVMQRTCGRADIFSNYVRASILANARLTDKVRSAPVKSGEDTKVSRSSSISAWPPVLEVVPLLGSRLTNAETENLNGISGLWELRCAGACGETVEPDDRLVIGADAAAGLTANVWISNDKGVTWTAAAADPFAADAHIPSVVMFYVGANTIRYLAGMEAPVGGQGMVGYSDDGGATWTTVNIGGAAAGHGVVAPRGLFARDMYHVFCAGGAGYIYKSIDGGETWTAVEAGVISTDDYKAIHFADEKYGMAVTDAGVTAVTVDGGDTWQAGGVIGGGANNNLSVWVLSSTRAWVGDDAGGLWYTTDFGDTWTQRTGWIGSGVDDVMDIAFINEYIGVIVAGDAVLRTICGGTVWEVLDAPANLGINSVYLVDENTVYAAGDIDATALGFVCKIVE